LTLPMPPNSPPAAKDAPLASVAVTPPVARADQALQERHGGETWGLRVIAREIVVGVNSRRKRRCRRIGERSDAVERLWPGISSTNNVR
jgi:hypothetical protein